MRDRVFGIETEYAVIYHPRRGEEEERPTNLALYALFEQALGARVASLPRAISLLRAKRGRFLENGASFRSQLVGISTSFPCGVSTKYGMSSPIRLL